MEPETGVIWPPAQEAKQCQQPPEAGRGRKEPPLEPPEGAWACDTLISDFWHPEPRENKFLLL